MQLERRIVLRILLSLLMVVLLVISAGVNYYFQRDAKTLVDAAEYVEGTINNKNCSNAGLVYYTFNADGKEYRGTSNACVASCAKATMGEKVMVTYARANPQNSICGSAEQAASRFDANYYALLLVGLGLLAIIFKTTGRKIE